MTFRNKKALVVALIYVTVPVLVWLLPPVCRNPTSATREISLPLEAN